ncbi:hypothetical protein DOTSEDRAFT_73447 [Dothistroma septosporum NZE10]|uniref:Uncharacterized protein n=1 Tax=Dothistroma septosporum (strain NZE10 / CBS 128990) TaxID=675120 RepID=N1PJ50_DOTSN|nr:hypothetical protein DOTSEDRAFT_73447 [Dothistroma septosporum NZE10]
MLLRLKKDIAKPSSLVLQSFPSHTLGSLKLKYSQLSDSDTCREPWTPDEASSPVQLRAAGNTALEILRVFANRSCYAPRNEMFSPGGIRAQSHDCSAEASTSYQYPTFIPANAGALAVTQALGGSHTLHHVAPAHVVGITSQRLSARRTTQTTTDSSGNPKVLSVDSKGHVRFVRWWLPPLLLDVPEDFIAVAQCYSLAEPLPEVFMSTSISTQCLSRKIRDDA